MIVIIIEKRNESKFPDQSLQIWVILNKKNKTTETQSTNKSETKTFILIIKHPQASALISHT